MVFPGIMYGCENWTIKKHEHQKSWCFWTVMLEKTFESPLDCKEFKPANLKGISLKKFLQFLKGNQSWIFIGRTDAKAEAPILWSPDVKNWLIGEDLDAGKDWRQEEKGTAEDEMVGWHHWLNGYEFKQTPKDGEGQGCCSPWGLKESTEQQNQWTCRCICTALR